MITILIAVYNTAQYLPQCLDSLKAQTYADWEAICVDDGSTDGSAAILNRYATDDSRIRVIHLAKNGGQAHARNIGLRIARGEWTTMLDSDDWLSPDALEKAVEKTPQTDCVLLRCRLVYPDKHEEEMPLAKKEWTPQQALADAITWQGIHGLYLVKTDIHRQFPYDESSLLYSDDNTARLHFLHSRRIVASQGIYYYRQHPHSMTHQVTSRRFGLLTALSNLQRTLAGEPLATDEIRQSLADHRWYILTDLWHYYFANRRAFSPEKKTILHTLRSSYAELMSRPVTSPLRHRLGYLPLRPHSLYVAQSWLYFILKKTLA